MKKCFLVLIVMASTTAFAAVDLSSCHGSYLISGSSNAEAVQQGLFEASAHKILNVEKFKSSESGYFYAVASTPSLDQEPYAVAVLTELREKFNAIVECNSELHF